MAILPSNQLIHRARNHAAATGVVDDAGEHTYGDLLERSGAWSRGIADDRDHLVGSRVAYLIPPGADHVALQWAVWRAGGVAVPLAMSHPARELAFAIGDARPSMVIVDASTEERVVEAVDLVARTGAIETPVIRVDELRRPDRGDSDFDVEFEDATMVYTSGTTGRPKGVVTSHRALTAQITTLVKAWGWSREDRILHVLPLHHVHGLVNALACPLWAGACCEFGKSDPTAMWERLSSGEISVFMAVPTVYRRLISTWEEADPAQRDRWSAGVSGLRLMVSGSAALPETTLRRWEEISGHRLLERYGMTEIGMALGNPMEGERRPGTVGQPFEGVDARIVDGDEQALPEGQQGELHVRGPQVFSTYWERPDETVAAFTTDGWFRTGDEAVVEDGYWRLVGRRSVDIIKTGGYKVSAVEIEAAMRECPGVEDVAVVGVPDDDWGERVCAAVIAEGEVDIDGLRDWCREQLAAYKVPKDLVLVDDFPRNAMGKVLKPQLRAVFTDAAS